jgi:rhodanese-related sulfurtransferase
VSSKPGQLHRQVDVGLVPRPWSSPVARRPWAIVAPVAWLLITLAPGLQIHYASAEQRAQALGARKTSEVSTLPVTGGLVHTFAVNSRKRVAVMEAHALGRRLAAADSADPDEAAALQRAARTEEADSERANIFATSMSRRPTARDGLDAATLQALQATPRAADMRRMDQNREIVVADQAGRRANRVTLVIVLAGLAVSILTLGATSAMSRRTPLDLAAGALLTLSLALLASVPFL